MGYYNRWSTPNTWLYKCIVKFAGFYPGSFAFVDTQNKGRTGGRILINEIPVIRDSVMGRPWRIFPTLCLAASVVSVRGRESAHNGQKPISSHEATASGNPLTSEFADFVLEILDEWKVPGVAVAVIDGDAIYAEVSPTVI